jgi:hypothetical protein
MQESVLRWATEEFGGAVVHGAQRKQIVRVAAQLALRPHALVSASMSTDADRQSAYGLLEGTGVSPEALALAQNIAAVRRASEYEYPFVPLDGSAIVVTDRLKSKGIGPIGSPPVAARGMKVMSAIIVSPDRTPIGVAYQQYWTRTEQRHRGDSSSRPIEERESYNWLLCALAVKKLFAEHAPNAKPWFNLDREGDFKHMLELAAREHLLVTIRANHDRRCGRGQAHRLWNTLRRKPVLGTYELHVAAGPNRTKRDATMIVRSAEVRLALGPRRHRGANTVKFHAVHTIEQTPPADGPRIEWLLLTKFPVTTFADAKRVIDGYAARWVIEEFHRIWKRGACHIEQVQLRSRRAIRKMAILLASVAMRIARLTQLAREKPDLPASSEFDESEIDAIVALRQPKGYDRHAALSLGQAIRWVADIGGYVGNKSSGLPGKTVVGRGLERVETAARAFRYVKAQKS